MNRKRLIACLLALLLALPLAIQPVLATTFPDVTGSWSWAAEYIGDMADKGIFKGYEDGTFGPGKELTAGQALAVCARGAGLTDKLFAQIALDRADEVTAILGTQLSWFHSDFAVCLELGIVTDAELKALYQSGALTDAITKEDFAFYLVRGMGLGGLAESLTSCSMSFADASSIAAARQSYVYLLYLYGIVQGTDENKFLPKSTLTRAVSATMLSRAVSFVQERGIVPELAEYTDYDWTAGLVTGASDGSDGTVLMLASGSGSKSVTVPDTAIIYQNNMPVTASALKEGVYARACYDENGLVVSVRVVSASSLVTVSGTVTSLSEDAINLTVSGVSRILPVNRFTSVTAGGVTGDRSLLDNEAGYSEAVCVTDPDGTVLTAKLTGGTTVCEGLIESVTTGKTTSLQVTLFNGVTRSFTVPDSAAVTVDNTSGTLKSGLEGSYVALKESNDTAGEVESAAVSTADTYIQGSIRGTTYTSNPNTIYLTNRTTGESTSYSMADSPVITYNGKEVAFSALQKDWFVTARLDSLGKVEMIEAYPGSVKVEGTITAIAYDTVTVITVTGKDGDLYALSLDMSDLPEIERDGSKSSIDKLRVGDTVTVTISYHMVTLISAKAQEANISGTVTRIIQDTSGSTLELRLEDGSTASYDIGTGTSVVKDGKSATISSLEPGDVVEMTVSDGQAVSITVSDSETSSANIAGTILYINADDKSILLRVSDSTTGADYIVTVNVTSSGTKYLVIDDGTSLSLSKLAIGDEIVAYGAYDGSEFDATIILIK